MGVCSSIIVPNEDVDDNTMSESRNSRGSVVGFRKALTISEAKNSYLIEGSLAVDSAKSEVEFRTLLDYPVAREYFLSALAEHRPALQLCFLGWLDIRLYSSLSNGDVMSQLGASIIQKYIRPPALTDEDLAAQITAMVESRGFYASLFDSVQICFLRELHDEMFVPFKQSVHFKEMTASIKKKYNRVRVSDFEYLSVLGKGTYGIVVKVRKRSTGALYAMKLQRKENMAERFGEDRWHVNFEKQAFASLRHPFIVELFYALQTKTLAILTMSLGSGKDLSSILRQNGPLSKKQVLFYSAEITSALSYLHHKGFIYRDLKPGNILLNADGHIQLVDFGAVCDLKGKTLGKSLAVADDPAAGCDNDCTVSL
jgi:tRNA A-37 threonylcarbamoyl transferase component Bud32